MSLISAVDLGFSYGRAPLFSKVNFELNAGECVALTGDSGCGKSTLCHILAGVIPRSYGGEIEGYAALYGVSTLDLTLAETVERVGIVFQSPDSQFFSTAVEAEAAFGPENLCLEPAMIEERVNWAFAELGIEPLRYISPEILSGGQKQLAAIASVIALRPKAIIFDEAFSALDSGAAVKVKSFISEFTASGGGVLMVEHDQDHLDAANRLLRMENGRVFEVSHG